MESNRLLQHPEFEAAASVAPNFTRDALKTINALEAEALKTPAFLK
jgi:hypothetical protein